MTSHSQPTVFFATDVRVHLDAEGNYRAGHNSAAYEVWAPFIRAFGHLNLVARFDDSTVSNEGVVVSGPGLQIHRIRHYRGLRQFATRLPGVLKDVLRLGGRQSIFIGRMPEPLSLLLYLRSTVLRARFICFVVAEPRQLFVAALGRPYGPVVGWTFGTIEKLCVRNAAGVVYVTQKWLQSLYPTRPNTPQLSRSNVKLPQEAFRRNDERNENSTDGPALRIVSVGSMEAAYKGQDLIIRAVAAIRANGHEVEVVLVGGGREERSLEMLAERLEVGHRIHFAGHVTGADKVREYFDAADLFVLTSRTEGLPRALIEAMARSLPAVSTRAGGVGELLDADCLVDVDDLEDLVQVIESFIAHPARLAEYGDRNFAEAVRIADLASDDRLVDFLRTNFVRPVAAHGHRPPDKEPT